MLKRWWYNWWHPKGMHPWRWRFLRWWIIIVSIALMFQYTQIRDSVQQNKQRITDIQASRIVSCITTYESFRQVFKPFFPPPGHRTVKQNQDLNKLNKIVVARKKQCVVQVQPK